MPLPGDGLLYLMMIELAALVFAVVFTFGLAAIFVRAACDRCRDRRDRRQGVVHV